MVVRPLKPQIAPHIAYQGDLGISTSARKELDEIFAGTRDCREKTKALQAESLVLKEEAAPITKSCLDLRMSLI